MRVIASLPILVLAAAASTQVAIWLPRTTAHTPPLGDSILAGDANGHTVAYFGTLHQTWIYDGVDWNASPTPATPNRNGVVGCFDTGRNRFVVLAGDRSNQPSTWEWDGSTWLDRGTVPFAARDGENVAYDSLRGVTVLFGGTQTSNGGFADTWEWNGASWTQRSSGGPFPRWAHGMTFDSNRGVTVLFGGLAQTNQQVNLGDTWEWNGVFWREYFGVPGPAARHLPGMTFDSRRNRTVLFGGVTNLAAVFDTWEWDGAAWTQRTTTGVPTANGSLAYDAVRGVTVSFAGAVAGSLWEYVATATVPGTYTPFGQGCASPAGVPQLAAGPGSLPQLGRTFTVRITNLPASPFNLPFGSLGFDNTSWNGQPLPLALDPLGFTGCQAWIAPALSYTLTNVAGTATWSIDIPLVLAFVGLDFYQQGAVLAPGANPGSIVFSNAGHGVVGTP